MMQRFRIAGSSLVMACGLLAGNMAAAQALTTEQRQRIHQLHVQMVVPQESIVFAEEPSRFKPDAFRLMLGDSAQSIHPGHASEMLARSLDRLLDADFRVEARAALPAAAADFPLPIEKLEVLEIVPAPEETARTVAALAPGQAYLRLLTHYTRGSRSDIMTARSQALLWHGGHAEAIYQGAIIVEGPSPRDDEDVDAVRSHMRLLVSQTLKAAGADLVTAKPLQPELQRFVLGRGERRLGEVVARDAQRVVLRYRGAILSVEH